MNLPTATSLFALCTLITAVGVAGGDESRSESAAAATRAAETSGRAAPPPAMASTEVTAPPAAGPNRTRPAATLWQVVEDPTGTSAIRGRDLALDGSALAPAPIGTADRTSHDPASGPRVP